jgi:Trk K+ transport system NAD-binding subunit
VITKRVRDMNKGCKLIVRYFQDDMAEVIEALGATEVVSSSKSMARSILAKLEST